MAGSVSNAQHKDKTIYFDVTADSLDGSIPNISSAITCFAWDIGIKFPVSGGPNSLTYAVYDSFGIAVPDAAGTITASTSRGILSSGVPLPVGFTVTFSGNTTNSATFQFIVYNV